MPARYALSVALFALLGAALANPALAQNISPTLSTVPSHVLVVGTDGNGVPDPAGACTFIIRDVASRPVNACVVVLDFTNTPDIVLSATQPGVNHLASCNGGSQAVVGLTGLDGSVTFTIVGRADHARPDAGRASLNLYADGFVLGTIPVAAIDQDGNGLSGADNSLWQADFFSPFYMERSDFDGDGVLSGRDLSLWLSVFFGAGSVANSTTSLCP